MRTVKKVTLRIKFSSFYKTIKYKKLTILSPCNLPSKHAYSENQKTLENDDGFQTQVMTFKRHSSFAV